MATPSEIKVKFNVETSEASKNVQDLNKQIEDTTKMVEEKKVFTLDTADSARGVKEVRQAIKDLNSASLELDEGSDAFIRVRQKVGELEDKMEDLGDATKALKGTGIEKLKGSLGLLKESFANMDFGKAKIAFKGLGGAMGAIPIFLVVQGLQFLFEKLEFFQVIIKPVEMYINMLSDALFMLTDAIGLTNHAAQEESKKATEGLNEEMKKQADAADRQIKVMQAQGKDTTEIELQKQKDIIKTTEAMIKQLEATGELTDDQKKQLGELKKNLLDSQAEVDVINAKADAKAQKDKDDKAKKAKEDADKKAKEAKDKYLAHQKDINDLKDKYILSDREKIAKSFDEDLSKLNRKNKDEEKLYQEILSKKQLALFNYDQDQKKKLEEEAQVRLDILKTNHETELSLIKDYNVSVNQIDDEFSKIRLENSKLTDEEIYKLIKDRLGKEKNLQEEAIKDSIEGKQLELSSLESMQTKYGVFDTDKKIELLNKIKEKRKEVLDSQMKSELDGVEVGSEKEKNIKEKYRQENEKLDAESQDRISEIKAQAIDKGLELAAGSLNALQSLDEAVVANKLKNVKKGSEEERKILKAAFNRNKAFQLVNTAIEGARAIVSALATPGADAVTKGILVGTAIVTTAASLAKIAASQYNENGGGGSAPSGGPPPPPSPSDGAPTNTFTIGQAQLKTFNEPEKQQMKVYVTETDIRDVSNKVKVIENRAVIR